MRMPLLMCMCIGTNVCLLHVCILNHLRIRQPGASSNAIRMSIGVEEKVAEVKVERLAPKCPPSDDTAMGTKYAEDNVPKMGPPVSICISVALHVNMHFV